MDLKPRIVDRSKPKSRPSSEDYLLASGVNEDDVDELAIATVKRLKQLARVLEETPAGEPIYLPPAEHKSSDHIAVSALKSQTDTYVDVYGEAGSKNKHVQALRMVLSLMIKGERGQAADAK